MWERGCKWKVYNKIPNIFVFLKCLAMNLIPF